MTLALVLAIAALLGAIALLLVWARRAGAREAELQALEQELEARRRKPHVGELCLVNTPLPDDQTLRGVVREVYDDGALLLGAAHHLAHDGTAIAAGDVYVPRASWVQIGVDPGETARHE